MLYCGGAVEEEGRPLAGLKHPTSTPRPDHFKVEEGGRPLAGLKIEEGEAETKASLGPLHPPGLT